MKTAIRHIERAGALLVFPIKNQKEPLSLWSALHPQKKMKWEWSDKGDDSVADLWHLMKQLSSSGRVVYSKWYQGRATFFSRDLFRAMLALSFQSASVELSPRAKDILSALEEDSPLSTKELKQRTELQGKFNETLYSKACKELFQQFLIVAYGEVEDGAFPSLAVGSTRLLFEDLWEEAKGLDSKEAAAILATYLPLDGHFRKFYQRILKQRS